ncbi:MAG: hypothetical protein KDD94_10920, partial [Calditrichaeota bacterium]|nr:hypothetical protein [Calditrichota bacterium]
DFKAQYTSNHQTISRDHDAQLEATERGEGFLPKLFHNRIIKNLTVSGNVAAVDLILRETVHKIKFVKQNDSWKVAADTYIDKTHG